MTSRRWTMLAPLVCGLLVAGVWSAAGEDAPGDFVPFEPSPTSIVERRLVQSLIDVTQGRISEGLTTVERLVREQPDFRLAHLVRGDLLLAMSGGLGRFGGQAPEPIAGSYRQEAVARLRRYSQSPPPSALPSAVLELPPSVPSAIAVDLTSYRLFVIENRDGSLRRGQDFYVSIGKGGSDKQREGDEKTPIGVYHVTSFIPGSRLPDLYGVGAFPISYPNGWDRLLGRTGSGIWIHGTESNFYSRPPLSSLGCVTLANEDFERLDGGVLLGRTPVVMAERLEWVERGEIEARRAQLRDALAAWRIDWESRDVERYLSHYAPDFRTSEMNRTRFAAHKRRVNAGKSRIQVAIEDLGVYEYPGEPDLMLAEFLQRYDSDTFRGTTRKLQYWRRSGDRWRIVFEDRI